MAYEIYEIDCLDWLRRREPNSIHAVVTDPPYGLREYTAEEITKLRNGKGGVWRIPPRIGGSQRKPLPRFTVLNGKDIQAMRDFFFTWGQSVLKVLVPGGHVFVAATTLWSRVVFASLQEAGFENRGIVARTVRTIRGGDRPKGAESEFSRVSSMPRGCWEPWGLFRKPFLGTLAENLRHWKTGALRRPAQDKPFVDLIKSQRTPQEERAIAPHPSLKPQRFMRQIVHRALPLGEGIVLDPFMGAGATIAAVEVLGYQSIGLEIDHEYFELARKAIPQLAALPVELQGYEFDSFSVEQDRSLENLPLFAPQATQFTSLPASVDPKSLQGDCQIPGSGLSAPPEVGDGSAALTTGLAIQAEQNWIY
jgi:site-specific DNA-methyltransferase (adenine-specific)